MQRNNLKRNHKNKKRRIVGRGGKHAKTSGRGTKGQNARAGHKKRPEIRDFIKRIPKLRGRGKNINTSIQEKFEVVNLGLLNKLCKDGDTISPETLVKHNVLKMKKGLLPRVKILSGGGEFTKKLNFEKCKVSESAKILIGKAGGIIK
jgi:large subunit ribosomal protein L15